MHNISKTTNEKFLSVSLSHVVREALERVLETGRERSAVMFWILLGVLVRVHECVQTHNLRGLMLINRLGFFMLIILCFVCQTDMAYT